MITEPSCKQHGFFKNQICDNNQSYGFNKTPKIQQREVLWGRTTAGKPRKTSPYRCLICLCENENAQVEQISVLLPLLLNWARTQSDWPLPDHCCSLLKYLRFCRFCIFLCLGPLNQELSPEISNPTKKCNWSEWKLTLWHKKGSFYITITCYF